MGQHYEVEMWKKYVNEDLDNERLVEMENHLSNCDECFEHYLLVIDDWSVPYSLSDSFTDHTIKMLKTVQPNLSQKEKVSSPTDYRKKTMFNYFLAAGLTIVLMFSGVFQFMSSISDKLDVSEKPYSEQIMEKTSLFFDGDQTEHREEEQKS